jgi:polyisoprenoid-binding protein YceI
MANATNATLSRTVDGSTVPAAGSYAIDPSHTNVTFWVRHLGLSKVRGRFASFEGDVVVAEDPTASSVSVAIDAASIDTRDATRDDHLRSGDFFDVDRHPTLRYRSTGVRQEGDQWHVDGELTIRDVTRRVPLRVTFEGVGTDPWGGQRAAFTAEAEINREEFGLTWNQALETGGVLVGRTIKVEIEVEAVRG